MRTLKALTIALLGVAAACGGAKKNANAMKEAPVKATAAYYITEVAGTPNAASTNKYVIELDKNLEGLTIDSLLVNGVPVEMMRMKDRPVIYGGSKAENFTGLLEVVVKGEYQKEKFELKLDSVYQKEQLYLPTKREE